MLIRFREVLYNLDNIQLGVLSSDEHQRGIEAVFELDYIVSGCHALESGTNSLPRGLQLQLPAQHGKPIDDTLIMESFRYLQFKVTPGIYHLDLRYARDVGMRFLRWKRRQ